MDKPTTIEDIAKIAGVSPSTVSRVLNGSSHVTDAKRASVLNAIAKHQYRPNSAARSLARGRSMTIGVVVQDIASPFFNSILLGIEQVLDHSGYQPMFVSTHWRQQGVDEDRRSLQLLLDRQVDGMIVLAGQAADAELVRVADAVPTIVVARSVPGLEQRCLTIDNAEGAYVAVRYLAGLGHVRIAHITGHHNHPDTHDRLAGYRRALHESGIAFDSDLVVEGAFNEEAGVRGVEQLLARGVRFSALFAANDQTAYGAMLALYSHDFRIPADISVVGFDDVAMSSYTLPPLTSVRQPAVAMGCAAATSVIALIDGREPVLPVFQVELAIRKSAAIYRAV